MDIKHYFLLAVLIVIFSSCKKKSCEAEIVLPIETEETVYEGWPIKMYFSSFGQYNVEIIGPNGFHRNYGMDDDHSGIETIESATQAHSGKYTVKIWDEKCLVKSGEVTIQVLTAPNPPCTISNNSGSTNISGVGGSSYSNIGVATFSSYYKVYGAIGVSQELSFTFNGNTPPQPGKYISRGLNYPDSDVSNQCAVRINTGMQHFYVKDNQDIYVNKVNNKLVVTMCPIEFTNTVGSTPLFLSAKLIVP